MIEIYDTTLRDGSQGEGISFSVRDKLRIARRLDEMGVHFIEGGWPGSNPKDIQFFAAAREELHLKNARLCAFGCTRRRSLPAAEDSLVLELADSGAPVVTIFGKSWQLHVREVLGVTDDENLEMIHDTVQFLRSRGLDVFYDAEHFFDGYKTDPGYARATLTAAAAGGAQRLILCDTNGGAMPWEVEAITATVSSEFPIRIGIHTHNDCELGVATALAGVRGGATQVQGTINGFGERTGNCNLVSIIANLRLKMDMECISDEQLMRLSELSAFVDEIANLPPNDRRPFVGKTAFAHKAGTHADAVRKNPRTCEHIDPTSIGNDRRVLVSELSGGSTIVLKASELGVDLGKKDPATRRIVENIARLEADGYVFEGAEATFELLLRREKGEGRRPFELERFRIFASKRRHDDEPITEAILKIVVNDQPIHVAAEGDGPVHALDRALRAALVPFYPQLERVRLTDYKVRVVDAKDATAAKVRVLVESTDGVATWSTIGVSTNIIEASWQALADSVEFALLAAARRAGTEAP